MGKWVAGLIAAIMAPVAVWWLTHPGGPLNAVKQTPPPLVGSSPDPSESKTVDHKGLIACGHSLDAPIYNKWLQLGGEHSEFGCPVMDAADAGPSQFRTTGRWAEFNGSDHRAMIFWHKNGAHAGQAYSVHGAIGLLYASMSRDASFLGFPITDEYDMPGGPPGRRSDFEGGYIQWNPQTRQYQAY